MSQSGRDAIFIAQDYRQNFKVILAKRPDLAEFGGGRMIPAGAGLTVTYQPGTVLGVVTASGLLAPYAAGNTDGSQVPVGVLSEAVTTDQYGNGSECVYITRGTLFKDFLIGLDAGAITALNGAVKVEHGTNLISIYK